MGYGDWLLVLFAARNALLVGLDHSHGWPDPQYYNHRTLYSLWSNSETIDAPRSNNVMHRSDEAVPFGIEDHLSSLGDHGRYLMSKLRIPNAVADTVQDDEQLLWVGQPRSEYMLLLHDLLLVPVGLIFIFTVGFAGVIALRNHAYVYLLLLLPVLLIGTLCLCRAPLDVYKRRNTYYLVTNKRVAVKTNTVFDRTVRSVDLKGDFQMTPIDGPRGSVTIYFGPTGSWDPYFPAVRPFLADVFYPSAFAFLDDAVPVMDLIIESRRNVT